MIRSVQIIFEYVFATFMMSMTLISCTSPPDPFRRETTAMGTFLSLSIYDEELDMGAAYAFSDLAFQDIARVESLATDYSNDSEIGRINLAAGIDSVRVSREILAIIRESLEYSQISGGAFDISIGPLVHQWNFLADQPSVPSGEAIDRILQLIDYRRILVLTNHVFLPHEGMMLDLGGIAKGYAVDRTGGLLRKAGLKNFILDLGGNLGVFWEGTSMFDSTRATIFIRHPRRPGEFIGHFEVGSAGVSTSGDYQRFFFSDGIRYHHLLDPETGMPGRDLVSVTIVAENATRADALSTSVFVMGRERGMQLIEDLPQVEGILIFEQRDSLMVTCSSGLRDRFKRMDQE